MNEIKLSNRLLTVANYIPEDIEIFADIGTDHAYLPCYICNKYKHIKAIAGDVVQGPYEAAVKQVQKAKLTNRIDVRLGDGLSILKDNEVDCITIAGMGGSLIKSILMNGLSKLNRVKRLILQPNIDSKSIRQFAVEQQYKIIDEQIIRDDGYIYEIIVLEPTSKSESHLNEKEQLLGPILLKTKNEVFIEKWTNELNKKKQIVDQILKAANPDFNKVSQFNKEIKWIEEEL